MARRARIPKMNGRTRLRRSIEKEDLQANCQVQTALKATVITEKRAEGYSMIWIQKLTILHNTAVNLFLVLHQSNYVLQDWGRRGSKNPRSLDVSGGMFVARICSVVWVSAVPVF